MPAMIAELTAGKEFSAQDSDGITPDPFEKPRQVLNPRVTQENLGSDGGGTAPGTCKTSGMHVNVRRLIYL